MAWGCKHAGPCGWAESDGFEWWCETCERGGWMSEHPDLRPHEFQGRNDRPCEWCKLPDRNPIHDVAPKEKP